MTNRLMASRFLFCRIPALCPDIETAAGGEKSADQRADDFSAELAQLLEATCMEIG